MAHTIIGLDIGTHAVKVVRCRRVVGGLRWHGSAQREFSHAEAWTQAAPAALQALLTNGDLRASRVVVGMPSHLISTRVLTLPFLSPEQVRQVVPFEVEGHLPFVLDDVVVESQLIHAREGSSQVMAAALPKASLREYLELCHKAGVNPAVVDAEAFALHAYARHALGDPDGCLALIDIGATKTTICVIRDRQLRLVRAVLTAGNAMTAAIQEALSISYEEAEQWKRSRDVQEEPIARALDPLLAEIRRSLHAYESAEGVTVPALFFTGGGSTVDGLPAYMAERLGTQLLASQLSGPSWPGYLGFATAVGLAVKGVVDHSPLAVNFRQGEFAVPREETSGWRRLTAVTAVSLLVLLGCTDLLLHYQALERRHRELKTQLRGMFQSLVPEVRVVDEVQQFKTAMREMQRKAAMFGSGRTRGLQFLIGLSERIPHDLKMEIQDLVMEREKVSVEAETDSFNSIDRVKAAVERVEGVGEVKVSEARVTADQTKVRFRLTLVVHERS